MTHVIAPPGDGEQFGYLLVHFIEKPYGHGERVYFSLSDGFDPTRWIRLNAGAPLLESTLGTTGVRDPFLVAGDGEYFIVATDLRVYGGDDAGWDSWRRRGSREVIVWRSEDLVHWSQPWTIEVVGPEAGMAWAPEAVYDADRRAFFVFWSSTLFDDDPEHAGETYSRVLSAWTPDFRSITPSRVMIDYGVDVIDTTIRVVDGRVHRISKEDSGHPDSRRVFHEVGSAFEADDFTLVQARIADEAYSQVEGPLLFPDSKAGTWYLLVDQFAEQPQGYIALTTTDLLGGWDLLPSNEFHMPPNTKHGSVLPLTRSQWDRLHVAFGAA